MLEEGYVIELLHVVQERDCQSTHAFLVIHTQGLKMVTHTVAQTLAQAMLELTLMVDVYTVPTTLE